MSAEILNATLVGKLEVIPQGKKSERIVLKETIANVERFCSAFPTRTVEDLPEDILEQLSNKIIGGHLE